jgi:glutamate/aspartate transport system permease protein
MTESKTEVSILPTANGESDRRVNYNWNWRIFFEPAPNGTGTYLDMLLSGLVLTIETAICAWILALLFGSIVGVLRTLPSKLAGRIGFAYVEFFRNMPLLVQLFLWFFVLPEIVPRAWGLWLKQMSHAPFYTAAIGIGLFMSARVAEQLRASTRCRAGRGWPRPRSA